MLTAALLGLLAACSAAEVPCKDGQNCRSTEKSDGAEPDFFQVPPFSMSGVPFPVSSYVLSSSRRSTTTSRSSSSAKRVSSHAMQPTPAVTSSQVTASPSAMTRPSASSSIHIFPAPSSTPSQSTTILPPSPSTSLSISLSLPLPSTSPSPLPSSPADHSSFSFVCPTETPNETPEMNKDCVSCDDCTMKLAIALGTGIPASILVTILAMIPVCLCCQKKRQKSQYIRMAPTVYFDEEDN